MLDLVPDRSLQFLARPYQFVSRQCRRSGSDVFRTRLLLKDTVCITGAEAAEMFYTEPRLKREGAAPEPVRATLFGKGGVQGLDGDEHRARKALLMGILSPENVARLARRVRRYWRRYDFWAPNGLRLPLYQTAQHVLTLSVCEWLGVPIPEQKLAGLSADLTSLFHDAARPAHLQSRRARGRLERWLAALVRRARKGGVTHEPEATLFQRLVMARNTKGELLPERVVAVELLNLMRPVVAISVYIVWMAHALLSRPALRRDLERAEPAYRLAFVEEVRRYYPFFPGVMARVTESFSWRGHRFEEGARVLLDIHGTNRDRRQWHDPDVFRPERFMGDAGRPYAFIPQGGGDAAGGHRCPGESTTVAIMLASLDFLLAHPPYMKRRASVSIKDRQLPAMPADTIYIGKAGAAAPQRTATFPPQQRKY